jgi:hypothetical protein
LPAEPAQLLRAGLIGTRQGTAQGRGIRQPGKPQDPAHQRVILVVADITQFPVAQQQMHDEQQHHHPMAEDRRDAQMLKTVAESPLQPQAGKQRLKNNQPGKRGELLVFKTQCGKLVGFTVYRGSATLHAERFPCHWLDCFGEHIRPIRKPFFSGYVWSFMVIFTILWNALSVNSRIRRRMRRRPYNTSVFLPSCLSFMHQ